jgi:hypothetical protein
MGEENELGIFCGCLPPDRQKDQSAVQKPSATSASTGLLSQAVTSERGTSTRLKGVGYMDDLSVSMGPMGRLVGEKVF